MFFHTQHTSFLKAPLQAMGCNLTSLKGKGKLLFLPLFYNKLNYSFLNIVFAFFQFSLITLNRPASALKLPLLSSKVVLILLRIHLSLLRIVLILLRDVLILFRIVLLLLRIHLMLLRMLFISLRDVLSLLRIVLIPLRAISISLKIALHTLKPVLLTFKLTRIRAHLPQKFLKFHSEFFTYNFNIFQSVQIH